MKTRLSLIMMIVLIMSGLRSSINSAYELPDLETKVALELGLEKRLKSILEEITGTSKISVSVNVHLYTRKERVTIERTSPATKKKSKEMVLPGVPVRKKLGEGGEPILAPLTYEENRTMIKRLTVTIFLDLHMSDELVSMVERVTKALLGMDPARKDELVIERIPFGTWYIDWKAMLQPPDIYWVSLVVLGLLLFLFGMLFLFGPFRKFFVQLVNSLDSLAEKGQASSTPLAQTGSIHSIDMYQQQASTKKKDEDKEKKPFSFITEAQLNDLIYLCRKERPEAIAITVSYLSPFIAARVIGSLEKGIQSKVIQELSQIKERPPELVQALEKKVKERIDYLVGGEDRLQQIVNCSDTSLQKDMLETLKVSNPSFAERIRKLMFSFEDIIHLDGNTIQMLIRNINPAIFAQVLKSMPEDFQKNIFKALSEGLSERIQQEIELGKPLTPKRIEQEKQVIVQLVKNFEQQGLIDLGK